MSDLTHQQDKLHQLRAWTAARIDLGRIGASMPTAANLAFSADHAAARDAVHTRMCVAQLRQQMEAAGFCVSYATSQAASRAEYLRRPDLGRRLHAESVQQLQCPRPEIMQRLTVVVADGLSAEAPMHYALATLEALRANLHHWTIDTVILAEQARVALGDEIGQLRHAEAVLMLIGERPGLKAADSLGAYLTYAPRVGTTDAARNCVSNIRDGGLGISAAVAKLVYLLQGARALGQSGVALKDNSELPVAHNTLTQHSPDDGWRSLLDESAGSLDR